LDADAQALGEELREHGADGWAEERPQPAGDHREDDVQRDAEAEGLGVFGSPTFVVEGELFWGQDRLDFVDRALDRLRQAKG
ncbi:MAG: DsbA family protein, partial [Microvirga sp.]